jgi:hypothetical protein
MNSNEKKSCPFFNRCPLMQAAPEILRMCFGEDSPCQYCPNRSQWVDVAALVKIDEKLLQSLESYHLN